ncbi:GAF domain-containing protein [Leptolyngbya sp. FACHB-261]|uniref:GAF domain-containing protein n=1 Tax=Leptolyngbya sp. FACHB-261 TaxID=2692806 RepID=UPI0016821E0B|nr:GAF domain-containing protein [Leptolyngbya sp. FACHB-261]MBD2103108.1 GAF domain-containing protein [Leptolyngbya sp. FACHB-261]
MSDHLPTQDQTAPHHTDQLTEGDSGLDSLQAGFQADGDVSLAQTEQPAPELWAKRDLDPSSLLSGAKRRLAWLDSFKRRSRLLIAVIEPGTWAVRYANDYFCQFTGLEVLAPSQGVKTRLVDLLHELDGRPAHDLYLRHILYLILRDVYQVELSELRPFEEPLVASVSSPLYPEPRLVEFWLHPDELKISQSEAPVPELGAWDPKRMPLGELEEKLRDPEQLHAFARHLHLERYRFGRIQGSILFEGSDVTVRETIRRINQLLIDRDSILHPEKFQQLNQLMRALFRASNSIILSAEGDQAKLFRHADQQLEVTAHSMRALQGSQFVRALEANQVWTVTDLALDCQTDCERQLLEQGVHSLLLIPLVVPAAESGTGHRQVLGLVGLTSDRPNHFDRVDCRHAKQLIPSFITAVSQAIRQRFSNIHPAVEWRFLQESERRTWGLPPEPIVFSNVYPLYGISDIRGSSQERNRAIQADLLHQFKLGLKVLDTVCAAQETAFGEQLRLDLLDHLEKLRAGVTVDVEVTAAHYLSHQLEAHFDYFSRCSAAARTAVETYRSACANEHQAVYVARAHYDQAVNEINHLLRDVWERWQQRMQHITPHYCDVQITDGIDHMIYAGAAIDQQFCQFHLHSLRYEQLRAMCDCARATLEIRNTNAEMGVAHLVLVQDSTVEIYHNEKAERLFDVRGTHDTRYEIVKKRIEKAVAEHTQMRITQPGMLTLVYSTDEEQQEYQGYLRYLMREGWIEPLIESGNIEPLQGVSGLRFARAKVLPAP